jgi:hypothetical protein
MEEVREAHNILLANLKLRSEMTDTVLDGNLIKVEEKLSLCFSKH